MSMAFESYVKAQPNIRVPACRLLTSPASFLLRPSIASVRWPRGARRPTELSARVGNGYSQSRRPPVFGRNTQIAVISRPLRE
jgi:hypothetical protein